MGPKKESCSGNKHLRKVRGEQPDNGVLSRRKTKKRKLSDMLDYQWTTDELRRFYHAFRKYGQNWKKVASFIRSRPIDMVESLYNLNRAYLSLPEGMATADGFLAMMTDYYVNLVGNNCDDEQKVAPLKTPRHQKSLKYSDRKYGLHVKGYDRNHMQNHSIRSSYNCSSKKRLEGLEGLLTDLWPRVVRPRTPRFPITNNEGEEASKLRGIPVDGNAPLIAGSQEKTELSQIDKERNAKADMSSTTELNVGLDNSFPDGYMGRMEVDNHVCCTDPLQMLADVSVNVGWTASAGVPEPALGHNYPGANPETNNLKMLDQRERGLSSLPVQRSNLPGLTTVIPDQADSRLSFKENENAAAVGDKSEVPESSYAISYTQKYETVQGDQGYFSAVRCAYVQSESDKPDKVISPVENSVREAVPETGQGKCHMSNLQKPAAKPAAENRHLEVEIHNKSSGNEHDKNKDTNCMPVDACTKVPAFPRNNTGNIDSFSKTYNRRKPDGCFRKCEMKCSTVAEPQGKSHELSHTEFHEDAGPRSVKTDGNPLYRVPGIPLTKLKKDDEAGAPANSKAYAVDEIGGTQHTGSIPPCLLTKVLPREFDIKAIADLTRALEKKETLLKELRYMNDVCGKQLGGKLAADSSPIIEHCGKIAKLLNKVNSEVTSALHNLRQHNTIERDPLPSWFKSSGNSKDFNGHCDSHIANFLNSEDSGSHVEELVMTSRRKASAMVDAVVLEISSLKGGEDAQVAKEALCSAVNERNGIDSKNLGSRDPCSLPLAYQNQGLSLSAVVNGPDPRACLSTANESQTISGLISNCVATLIMIKATSEKRYPPADVARILDDAVESLQPRCSQNLPVYREIKKCMGYIKAQMLALVPSPDASPHAEISV